MLRHQIKPPKICKTAHVAQKSATIQKSQEDQHLRAKMKKDDVQHEPILTGQRKDKHFESYFQLREKEKKFFPMR